MALSALALAALPTTAAHAGATSDTSWGRAAQSFSGQFVLPEALGRRAGNNLFHSFSRFSIDPGESATFTTTTPTLANVIARVTGPEASVLSGTLRLTAARGSAPDFYLINPQGLTFAAGTRVDVPAAFHASTAQELRFADGAAAAPVRLSANARVNAFVDGRDMDITAGSIAMANAFMHTETGALRLVATGGEAASVPVDPRQAPPLAAMGGAITLATSFVSTAEGQVRVHAGTLDLSAGASINAVTSLFAPGSVDISVRDGLRLRDSLIYSHMATEAASAGAPLRVHSGGSIDIGGRSGGLQTSTETRSAAGDIQVTAASMSLGGRTNVASFTGAPGSAGRVSVQVAGPLDIRDTSGIFSQAVITTFTDDVLKVGPGGSIDVRAGALTLDGSGGGGNSASIGSDSIFVPSPAGNITVTVDGPLVLRQGGNITSSAVANPDHPPFSTQKAGAIQVRAGTVLIENTPDRGVGSGIFSDSLGVQETWSLSRGPGGAAGRVEVEAREIRMLGGTVGISADTSGPGPGGTVTVKADRLLLDGRDEGVPSISSTTLGGGAGGVVTVQVADTIELRRGGLIQALAGDAGRGGSVTVQARMLTAEGSGPDGLTTGILGTSVGAGAAGDITLQVSDRVSLVRGAVISANAFAQGASGAIRVATRDLVIDGQGDPLTGIRSRAAGPSSGQVGRITVVASGTALLRDAPEALTIRNESVAPDLPALVPQAIVLRAGDLVLDRAGLVAASSGAAPGNAIGVQVDGTLAMRRGSAVLTSAQDGSGGPIDIAAGGHLLLQDAQVQSSVLGVRNGNGGNIRITTPVLVLDHGAVQANTAAARASGGDIAIAVEALVPSGSALRVGGSEPLPFDPSGTGPNIIQAAAPEGLSGNVQVAVPALDLAGSLRALEAQVLDVGIVGSDFCGLGSGSSLVRAGRGALPPSIRDAMRPGR